MHKIYKTWVHGDNKKKETNRGGGGRERGRGRGNYKNMSGSPLKSAKFVKLLPHR